MDGVETEFKGKLTVLRLNIQDPEGRKAASRLGLSFTPTFVLFDGSGKELWRTVGALDPGMVRQSLGSP